MLTCDSVVYSTSICVCSFHVSIHTFYFMQILCRFLAFHEYEWMNQWINESVAYKVHKLTSVWTLLPQQRGSTVIQITSHVHSL